jgi:hypothetical protein
MNEIEPIGITNFWISEIKYDSTHSHIEEVKVSRFNKTYDNFSGINDGLWRTRDNIVKNIQNKKEEFYTIYFDESEKKYKPGKFVNIFSIGGNDYLKTEKNNIQKDNLGDLPHNNVA